MDSGLFSEQHENGFIIHFIINVIKSSSCVNAFYIERFFMCAACVCCAECPGLYDGTYICIRNTKYIQLELQFAISLTVSAKPASHFKTQCSNL